jgi:glycosyltransferase involved in cell wall biosynthesis
MIGPGPEIDKVRRLAETRGIADVVRVMGAIPFDSVPNYLASADFFVTASDSEVHPLTVIEALAAGLPVIAYDVSGMRETVIDTTGLLAQPERLSESIVVLANDTRLRSRLSIGAAQTSLNYDFTNTVDATLTLYKQLLNKKTVRTRSATLSAFPKRLHVPN